MAVPGAILGAFSLILPLSFAANLAVSVLRGAPPGAVGISPVGCDCATVAPVAMEFRLVAESGGESFPRRGGTPVLLEAEPLVGAGEFAHVSALRDEGGLLRLAIEIEPAAAARLAERGAPGRQLAVVVAGECIQVSTIEMALPASMTLHAGFLSDAEACGIQCGTESR